MSPLYKRRRELAAIRDRESKGESFWTEEFSVATRNRLILVMLSSAAGGDYQSIETAKQILLSDLGQLSLFRNAAGDSRDQFFRYLAECDHDMVPSVVEAFLEGSSRAFRENSRRQAFMSGIWQSDDSTAGLDFELVREVNRILAEDRVAFELVNGEMVPFASRSMHREVVEPVVRLLAEPGWERVEKSFQDALSELSRGKGANAITDAGTALQEALIFLGADGNQLGDLTTSAKAKGIIAAHDAPLLNAIERACRWVSADRSNTGDAHNSDDASREDAWFTVHVVGAIVLRLSTRRPRAEL